MHFLSFYFVSCCWKLLDIFKFESMIVNIYQNKIGWINHVLSSRHFQKPAIKVDQCMMYNDYRKILGK